MASGEQQAAIEGYRNHGVFTYALLEGLAKAGSGDKVQLLRPCRLCSGHRARSSAGSCRPARRTAPKDYCQKPIVSLGHTPDIRCCRAIRKVLAMLGADAPEISARPTHVVVAAADLFEAASRGGTVKRQLKPGELVTWVSAGDGWAYIAKDGNALGYVEEDKLLAISE